jgi:competence protein ComEA
VPVLTPSERRGAMMLIALCALGAAWDLHHARPTPGPSAGSAASAVAADAAAAAAVAPEPAAGSRPSAAALDLNRATAAELDRLPGIGPVLAARIVEQRRRAGPFRSPEELLAVRGIGPRLLQRLRPLVMAGEARGGPEGGPMQIAMPSRQ